MKTYFWPVCTWVDVFWLPPIIIISYAVQYIAIYPNNYIDFSSVRGDLEMGISSEEDSI